MSWLNAPVREGVIKFFSFSHFFSRQKIIALTTIFYLKYLNYRYYAKLEGFILSYPLKGYLFELLYTADIVKIYSLDRDQLTSCIVVD